MLSGVIKIKKCYWGIIEAYDIQKAYLQENVKMVNFPCDPGNPFLNILFKTPIFFKTAEI